MMLPVALLSACSGTGLGHVKTSNGYLSETKVTLPDRPSKEIGHLVFIRDKTQNKNIPTIFINERVVGSLPPERFSETLVCPGKQVVRIGTRAEAVKIGQNSGFNVAPGSTHYIQVLEASGEDFAWKELTEEQAKDKTKNIEQSHIINRHQPVCDKPKERVKKVLKHINLEADALFKFDTTQILAAGQASIGKLVQDIESLNVKVEEIHVIGHTDRLGGEAYNEKLSRDRAIAVSDRMKRLGLAIPITTEGRGKREPVTTSCQANLPRQQLISCLQPDRRVSIELIGFEE